MPAVFFYYLNVIMISRLAFAFREKPISRSSLIVTLIIQIVGLFVLQPDWTLIILAVVLCGLGILFFFLENKKFHRLQRMAADLNKLRLVSFVVYIVLGSILFSAWVGIDFNAGLADFSAALGRYTLLVVNLSGIPVTSPTTVWPNLHSILFGALLVTNEANLFIRLLLQALRLAPPAEEKLQPSEKPALGHSPDEKQTPTLDEREFNAGRVIGILERLLIYYFVLNAQYSAIGFILAAKSFTRFRELEKRAFAEYVLVGTLLSALLAMLGAGLVQVFIF